jgi:hypothetical protein
MQFKVYLNHKKVLKVFSKYIHMGLEAGIAQTVQRLATGWTDAGSEF